MREPCARRAEAACPGRRRRRRPRAPQSPPASPPRRRRSRARCRRSSSCGPEPTRVPKIVTGARTCEETKTEVGRTMNVVAGAPQQLERVRVVVVDDNDDVRLLLRLQFTRDPRFEVVGEGSDGNDAIALAETHQPDL